VKYVRPKTTRQSSLRDRALQPLDEAVGPAVPRLRAAVLDPQLTGRLEAGVLLRRLQRGQRVSLPQSRPLPNLGSRCHELSIQDAEATWRLIYRLDADAVIIVEVFSKKSRTVPKHVIETWRRRLRQYDRLASC
jgi:phage-related protein